MSKVGCAGIVVADTFCGPMERLPKEGELLALDGFEFKVGGCAANVAIGLAKQGVGVELSGCVGRDANADQMLSILQGHEIGCRAVVRSASLATSQTVILLVKGEDRRFIHVFGANRDYCVSHINQEWVEGLDVLYLGGLFALPGINMKELGELLKFCRARRVTTVVDVVVPQQQKGFGGLDRVLPYVDYFLPNDQEAERLTGKSDVMDQLRAFRKCGVQTVIITQGSQGAVGVQGDDLYRAGVFRTQVVDPSGSGDAFAAGVVTGIVEGWPMTRTLAYASALGCSAVRSVGCTDSVFTRQEADEFLRANTLEIVREKMVD